MIGFRFHKLISFREMGFGLALSLLFSLLSTYEIRATESAQALLREKTADYQASKCLSALGTMADDSHRPALRKAVVDDIHARTEFLRADVPMAVLLNTDTGEEERYLRVQLDKLFLDAIAGQMVGLGIRELDQLARSWKNAYQEGIKGRQATEKEYNDGRKFEERIFTEHNEDGVPLTPLFQSFLNHSRAERRALVEYQGYEQGFDHPDYQAHREKLRKEYPHLSDEIFEKAIAKEFPKYQKQLLEQGIQRHLTQVHYVKRVAQVLVDFDQEELKARARAHYDDPEKKGAPRWSDLELPEDLDLFAEILESPVFNPRPQLNQKVESENGGKPKTIKVDLSDEELLDSIKANAIRVWLQDEYFKTGEPHQIRIKHYTDTNGLEQQFAGYLIQEQLDLAKEELRASIEEGAEKILDALKEDASRVEWDRLFGRMNEVHEEFAAKLQRNLPTDELRDRREHLAKEVLPRLEQSLEPHLAQLKKEKDGTYSIREGAQLDQDARKTLNAFNKAQKEYNRRLDIRRTLFQARERNFKDIAESTIFERTEDGVVQISLPGMGRIYYEPALGTPVLIPNEGMFDHKNGLIVLKLHGSGGARSNVASFLHTTSRLRGRGFNPIALSMPMSGPFPSVAMGLKGLALNTSYLDYVVSWIRKQHETQIEDHEKRKEERLRTLGSEIAGITGDDEAAQRKRSELDREIKKTRASKTASANLPLVVLGRSAGSTRAFALELLRRDSDIPAADFNILTSFSNPETIETQNAALQKKLDSGTIGHIEQEDLDHFDFFQRELLALLDSIKETAPESLQLFGDNMLSLQGDADDDGGATALADMYAFRDQRAPLMHVYAFENPLFQKYPEIKQAFLDYVEKSVLPENGKYPIEEMEGNHFLINARANMAKAEFKNKFPGVAEEDIPKLADVMDEVLALHFAFMDYLLKSPYSSARSENTRERLKRYKQDLIGDKYETFLEYYWREVLKIKQNDYDKAEPGTQSLAHRIKRIEAYWVEELERVTALVQEAKMVTE